MHQPRRSQPVLPSIFSLVFLCLPLAGLAQDLPVGTDRELSDRWQSTHWGGPFQVDPSILEQRFRDELQRCEAPADVYEEISCHLFDGLQKMETGQLELGREALGRCLELLEEENDLLGKILILVAMAETERYFQRPEKAMQRYRQAVELVESLGGSDIPLRLESFRFFARLSGQPETLFDQIAPMLQMMRPMFVNLVEVLVRDTYGTALLDMGQNEKALSELERAAELSGRLFGLYDGQVLDHLAQAQQQKGDFDRAAELFDKAFAAAERMGNLGRQFGVLDRMADLEQERGRFEAAIAIYGDALAVARRARHPAKEAEILIALADIHGFLGDMENARARLREALKAAERSADPWVLVQARMSSAALAFWTGHYERAIGTLEATLDLLDTLGIQKPEIAITKVSALVLLSQAYVLLGRYEQIEAKVQEALALATRFDFREGMAASRVLLNWSPEDDPETLGELMTDLSPALLGSTVPSLRYFGRQADAVFRSWTAPQGDGPGEIGIRSPLPSFRMSARIGAAIEAGREERYDDGIRILQKFVADSIDVGHRDLAALGLVVEGALLWKAGRKQEAATRAVEGLDRMEKIVDDFLVDEVITIFMSSYRNWLYDVTVEILVHAGHPERAFEMVERSRARALLHQLGNQRLAALDTDSDLRHRFEKLRRELDASIRNGASEKELEVQRMAYDQLEVRAKLEHPEYADLKSIDPATLSELQTRLLPPETTLVSYFFTWEGLLAWVVDRQGVAIERMPIEEDFRSDILCFSRRLGRPRGGTPLTGCRSRPLKRMEERYYDQLWRPLAEHVRHENVIIVPHQQLHYLPFAALRNGKGKYLSELKTLSYLPSISVLRHIDRKRTPFEGRALILGDPVARSSSADAALLGLDGARREAKSIARLLGDRAWVGDQATEAKIWQAQGQVDLLHIAAHGIFRPQAPRFSRLALAEGDGHDGSLEVEEVYRALNLEGVDLVTLSACQTALGDLTAGDEIIGLNRAFLYAGSPAVLSTLWRVDDAATAVWMESFYQHLLDGAGYAEAVRQAQQATRAHPGFEDPHYWAGFVLTGDPHRRWKELDTTEAVETVSETADTRGAIPLPREFRASQSFDPWQSAGVFVGIGEFPKDEAIADIPHAVDDAVDLAHLFSLELGLIPPDRVRLLLSGRPGKPDSEKRLDALKAKGARVLGGSTADLLKAVAEASADADEDGFFVVSLATHGFTDFDRAEHYLMTDGSSLDFVSQTSVRTEDILHQVSKAAPKRSLVLVDACREKLRKKHAAEGPDEESRLSPSFLHALSKAEGQVVMTAAREGEYAYDDTGSGNGVFSGAVLAGLRCSAWADSRGLITSQTLCSFVNQRISDWQTQKNRGASKPGIECRLGGDAADLPLALCGQSEDDADIWLEKGEVVVVLELEAQRIEEIREENIDYELNKHKYATKTTEKHYSRQFDARPGLRMVGAALEPRSQHEVHSLKLAIAGDKQSATLSFRLKSGPKIDRYRGWLRGKVLLTEERLIEAGSRSFPIKLDFTRFGRYEVSSVDGLDISRIGDVTIESAEGTLFAHGNFGDTLLVADDRYQLRTLVDGDKLFLEVYSHLPETSRPRSW